MERRPGQREFKLVALGAGTEWDGQGLDEGGGKWLLGLLHSPRLRFVVGGLKVLILLKITN